MSNILVINHNAGSPVHGMEYRPFYLAREWVRRGHKVRILAASYSHVRSAQPIMRGPRQHQVLEGIEYCWLKTPRYDRNGLARFINILAFLLGVERHYKITRLEFKPDIVVASSTYPLDIWVANRIAKACGAKLVFEVHDLWPASLIELADMHRWHPFVKICAAAERSTVQLADVIVSMLPFAHEHYRSLGLEKERMVIIPNGVAPEEWSDVDVDLPSDLSGHLCQLKAARRTVVGYLGSHGKPNALEVLLRAAAQLGDKNISFVLVGDGLEKKRLMSENMASNVSFFPPIIKTQVGTFLRQLDIAYIGWRNKPLYRFGIAPNKLMDYMMAGRVILHSTNAGNDPVELAGCGLKVSPESVGDVAAGLVQLAGLTLHERNEMGRRGREYVTRFHTYPTLAERFLEGVMDKV